MEPDDGRLSSGHHLERTAGASSEGRPWEPGHLPGESALPTVDTKIDWHALLTPGGTCQSLPQACSLLTCSSTVLRGRKSAGAVLGSEGRAVHSWQQELAGQPWSLCWWGAGWAQPLPPSCTSPLWAAALQKQTHDALPFPVLLPQGNSARGKAAWVLELQFCISGSQRCSPEPQRPGPSPLPPRPVLGALDQASVVRHDFMLWQVECKFQGH